MDVLIFLDYFMILVTRFSLVNNHINTVSSKGVFFFSVQPGIIGNSPSFISLAFVFPCLCVDKPFFVVLLYLIPHGIDRRGFFGQQIVQAKPTVLEHCPVEAFDCSDSCLTPCTPSLLEIFYPSFIC
jgi:hypothetical protein